MSLRWLRVHLATVIALACLTLIVAGAAIWFGWEAGRAQGPIFIPRPGSLVGFAAAVGLSSMALIQSAKLLFGVRGLYHEWQLARWFGGEHAFPALLSIMAVTSPPREARSETRRFFDLPIEHLAGEIGVVAELALSIPETTQHGEFLWALLGPKASGDIETLVRLSGDQRDPTLAPEKREENEMSLLEVRTRLEGLVQRTVDVLQVSIGNRWRRYVRVAAVLLSGVIGIVAARLTVQDPDARSAYVAAALLLGGFTAWVARDVVAIIERLRRSG